MSWGCVRLSTVADVFNGKTPSEAEQRDKGFPVLKIKDVDENFKFRGAFQSFVDSDFYEKHEAKKIQLCDSLILNAAHNSDYVGSKQYCAEADVVDSVATGEWLVCRAKQGLLSPKYLNFWLRSETTRFEMKGLVKGIHLYPKDVARLEIPLPPLETQKQIAAILEKADQLCKDCQQMEQELNNLAQSVFMEMFGDPVSNPKRWELRPCAAICEDITVGVVVKPASYYAISGVPALRSLNVRENKLSDENLVYFSEEANEKKVPKSRIYEGNVLIVRSGQPGRAAVVTKKYDGCNCIDVLIARPDKTVIEPHFLSFFLNSEGGRRLVLKEERGQIQKHLNVKALNEALIPVPDIKHQNKFVAFLAGNQLRLDECKANLAELEVLYSSLVKKAFNGELNIKNKAA